MNPIAALLNTWTQASQKLNWMEYSAMILVWAPLQSVHNSDQAIACIGLVYRRWCACFDGLTLNRSTARCVNFAGWRACVGDYADDQHSPISAAMLDIRLPEILHFAVIRVMYEWCVRVHLSRHSMLFASSCCTSIHLRFICQTRSNGLVLSYYHFGPSLESQANYERNTEAIMHTKLCAISCWFSL